MNRFALLALLLFAPAVAMAQLGSAGPQANCPSFGGCVPTLTYQPTYQLLGTKGGAGATATGAAIGPVYGGSYIFSIAGTFSGAGAQLQVLGPDGITWQSVGSALTAAGSVGVVLGSTQGSATPNVRVLVTGSGYTLFASLS